jgi:hypothetical protein
MMSVGSIPSGPTPATQRRFMIIARNANVFADMTIHNRVPVRLQYGA